MLCEGTECAAECLNQSPVIETLLAPVIALLNGQQVTHTHTHIYLSTVWITDSLQIYIPQTQGRFINLNSSIKRKVEFESF